MMGTETELTDAPTSMLHKGICYQQLTQAAVDSLMYTCIQNSYLYINIFFW